MPNTRVHLAVAFSVCLVATFGPAKGEGGPADECRVVALEALTAQCVREPETSAFYNAGRAFDRSGHRTLAIQQYSSALAHTKRPIELFLAGSLPELAMRHRGVGHRELGDLSQAMADFDALIEADHGNSDARYERARTLLELGRLSDAAADAEIGAWLRPYTADFHHLHAQVLSRMGCHDEAAAVTIQAQKYPPPSELSESLACCNESDRSHPNSCKNFCKIGPSLIGNWLCEEWRPALFDSTSCCRNPVRTMIVMH